MIPRLIEHATWADLTWSAFLADHGWDEAPARLLSHVVLASEVWLMRLRGNEPSRPMAFRFLGRDELDHLVRAHDSEMTRLVRERAQERIAYLRFDGTAHESSITDILLHSLTHGFHHRGQLAAWSARRGLTPPDVAFISFCSVHGY